MQVIDSAGHVCMVGGTHPSGALSTAGAGSGGSFVISGTDACHQLVITTGTSPQANSLLCTVNYNVSYPYGYTNYVNLTPANAAALGVGVYPVSNANSYTVNVGTTPLSASTVYIWNAN